MALTCDVTQPEILFRTSKFVDLEPLGALWLSLQTALDLTIAGIAAIFTFTNSPDQARGPLRAFGLFIILRPQWTTGY